MLLLTLDGHIEAMAPTCGREGPDQHSGMSRPENRKLDLKAVYMGRLSYPTSCVSSIINFVVSTWKRKTNSFSREMKSD